MPQPSRTTPANSGNIGLQGTEEGGSVAALELLSDYHGLSDVIANKPVAREGEEQWDLRVGGETTGGEWTGFNEGDYLCTHDISFS